MVLLFLCAFFFCCVFHTFNLMLRMAGVCSSKFIWQKMRERKLPWQKKRRETIKINVVFLICCQFSNSHDNATKNSAVETERKQKKLINFTYAEKGKTANKLKSPRPKWSAVGKYFMHISMRVRNNEMKWIESLEPLNLLWWLNAIHVVWNGTADADCVLGVCVCLIKN